MVYRWMMEGANPRLAWRGTPLHWHWEHSPAKGHIDQPGSAMNEWAGSTVWPRLALVMRAGLAQRAPFTLRTVPLPMHKRYYTTGKMGGFSREPKAHYNTWLPFGAVFP